MGFLNEEELKEAEENRKKQMQEEINAMSGMDTGGTEAPSTETPAEEDDIVTDAPEEEVETDAPTTEAPQEDDDNAETDAPTTIAPTEDDELIALRAKAAEYDLLMEGSQSAKTSAPSTDAPTTDAPLESLDFLKDIDMETMTSDPETFNTVLNNLFQKAVEVGKASATESVLRSIPGVMGNVVNSQLALQTSVNEFYTNNEDLATPQNKRLVALQAEKLGSAHPEWPISKLFDESGKAVRKTLGLKTKTTVKKDNTVKTPKFAKNTKGKSKPKTKPDLTPLQKELQDMANVD